MIAQQGLGLLLTTSLSNVYSAPGDARYVMVRGTVTNINSLNPNAKVTVRVSGGSRTLDYVFQVPVVFGTAPLELPRMTLNPGEVIQAQGDASNSLNINLSVGEVT